ncbi:hypothetical protein [Sulfurimonas sp. HSL-1716]|uniref:hypothetical protein n=1 Tax=Hydrocurvibacter sulfurireducens TaxID=3131937 RepID=UPI0031F8D9AC
MKILTKYTYEKSWRQTKEQDLLRIIKEEIGEEGAEGTLAYVKDVCKKGRSITVGSCSFKGEEPSA